MNIETKRLIIKSPSFSDFDKIRLLDTDPVIMRYIGNGLPRSESDSRMWFTKAVSHYEKHRFSFGLVFEKTTGEFIGRAGINHNAYDDTQPDIEIGYRLLQKFWNRGYATELSHALVEWGFENLHVIKLCGFVHPDNKASQHVLEKIGMQLIGLDKYADEDLLRYELLNPIIMILAKNIKAIYGEKGKQWLSSLPAIIKKFQLKWNLNNIIPVNNMTFHYVAKAIMDAECPVVLKIGVDPTIYQSEKRALEHFAGNGIVKLIDYYDDCNALLLQQIIPGKILKSIYPNQSVIVLDAYIETIKKMHINDSNIKEKFPHISEWLAALDKVSYDKLPKHLLDRAISLKNYLLNTMTKVTLLHGDLHLENILQHENSWLAIDPKGVIGEIEFEMAAFDFNSDDNLFINHIDELAILGKVNQQRLKDWVFVRLILKAVWMLEDQLEPNEAIRLAEILYNFTSKK